MDTRRSEKGDVCPVCKPATPEPQQLSKADIDCIAIDKAVESRVAAETESRSARVGDIYPTHTRYPTLDPQPEPQQDSQVAPPEVPASQRDVWDALAGLRSAIRMVGDSRTPRGEALVFDWVAFLKALYRGGGKRPDELEALDASSSQRELVERVERHEKALRIALSSLAGWSSTPSSSRMRRTPMDESRLAVLRRDPDAKREAVTRLRNAHRMAEDLARLDGRRTGSPADVLGGLFSAEAHAAAAEVYEQFLAHLEGEG